MNHILPKNSKQRVHIFETYRFEYVGERHGVRLRWPLNTQSEKDKMNKNSRGVRQRNDSVSSCREGAGFNRRECSSRFISDIQSLTRLKKEEETLKKR